MIAPGAGQAVRRAMWRAAVRWAERTATAAAAWATTAVATSRAQPMSFIESGRTVLAWKKPRGSGSEVHGEVGEAVDDPVPVGGDLVGGAGQV